MTRSSNATTVVGTGLLLATGLVDLVLYFGKSIPFGYPGILFLLNAAAAIVLAVALLFGLRMAWHLGALLTAVTIISFILARTTGLPGLQLSDWLVMLGFIPLGPVSLVAEGLFVAVYLVTKVPARRSLRPAPPSHS